MTPEEFARELASYDEKIALAELEIEKASERASELKYQKARFVVDVQAALCKAKGIAQPDEFIPTC